MGQVDTATGARTDASKDGPTDKERQVRGLDALGRALRPVVDERMSAAAHGRPWVELYEAKESARLGRPYRADAGDPRLLLRVLRYERGVFTEVDASQRAWIDELIQASNRAAHSTTVTGAQVDRALDTTALLAESLGLDDVVEQVTALAALGAAPDTSPVAPPVNSPDAAAAPPAAAPADDVVPAADAAVPSPAPAVRVPLETPPPRGIRVLTARVGDLDVVVQFREAVNYALVHNRVSVVAGVTVTHRGTTAVPGVVLTLTIDPVAPLGDLAVAAPLVIDVGAVAPGARVDVPAQQRAWRLSPEPFVALDEAVTVGLHLTVATPGTVPVRDSADVRLLTADEWWAVSIPESLAAFVRPNDPAVVTLLGEASELLAARTGSPSLEGYQSGADRVHQIAEAVYDALAARRITYVEAPSSFEGTGQRIRTHAAVLEERRGTCLDLACTYAAALEQAGLHPVLVVVDGHAFTGYLTEESELPSVTVTEPAAIVTVADSDLFDAVETTAVCASEAPRGFDEARGAVRHWWRADLDQVSHLFDVHAAHRYVRPLPAIRTEGGVRIVEVVRETVAAPLRRVPATAAHPDHATGTPVPPRVERWQRSLLDMTYVNPLLKLKDASSLPVHVPAGGLARLEDTVSADQDLTLAPHDELAEIHRAQGARTAADVDPRALLRILDEERTLFVAIGQKQYTNRLRTLQRKARASLEETGTDTLYLTLGTLEWQEPNGKEGRAPLFLLPVRLVGGRGGTSFSLERDDTRTMEPNYCLVEKLRVAWGLELPELTDPGEDESGIDVAGALASVRTTLLRAKATTFHVEETARLALLQFSTLEMWRDLRQNWSRFVTRPAVEHLVHTPGRPYVDGIEPPEAEPSTEASTYLPIPADGSQIEAVRWAAAGKSFILEGPPGTGKSQTITNLIAHCLAEGKKVLFVAEKQAALEVVKKRLDGVGLGELSLDLHGRNQTVTAVRQRIGAALDLQSAGSPTWDALRASYRTLTESLARYPGQLHEVGPVDMSAWQARQILLEHEEATAGTAAREVDVPQSVVMGQVALADVYDGARDLGTALLDLGVVPDRAPWRLAGPPGPGALDRAAVGRALAELTAADDAVADPRVRAITMHAATAPEIDAVAAWLDTARQGTGRATAEAARLVTPAWREQAARLRADVEAFRAAQTPRLRGFLPGVLAADLDGALALAREADGRLFGRKKRRLAVLGGLTAVLPPGVDVRSAPPFPVKELTAILQDLAALRSEVRDIAQRAAAVPGTGVPPAWNPLDDAQAAALLRVLYGLEVAAHLRAMLGAAGGDPTAARDAADAATGELLRDAAAGGVPDGAAVRRLGAAWATFVGVLGAAPDDLARWFAGRPRGEAMAQDLPRWTADAAGGAFIALQRWVRVRSALARLEGLGVSLTDHVRGGALRGPDVENQVRLGVAHAVLDERFDSTGLSGFDDAERDRLVDRFLATGDDVRERMAAELSARIVRARTFDPNARVGSVAELRQQLGRRRGGLTVRQLMHRYGSLITEITPCFLMSPTSVARFLPADAIDFDVVVFDEASQIRVPEAIGAMGRGRSVVIVGDSKQMPPTSMFGPAAPDDDDDLPSDDGLPVPTDLESILSEGVESRLPRLLLSWHYRSRDEALIAFSNSHYYEGRLSSFPAPPPRPDRVPALALRRVDGVWEGGGRGAARVNRAEASAVVAEVHDLLAADHDRSLGVVTFNTQQRELILNLLEDVRTTDPLVEAALTREEEPLFVKNLENVQGDERDVVLFTLAFAADARGQVPLNWGPLSRAGGERRLNVAVTRAKEKVVVFCSFEPHQLDLTASTSTGLADLKDYLLAARDGVESAGLRRAGARDRHLDDVAATLRAAGLEVRTGVGLSDFTVDLAVRAEPGLAWVAVMLDGPVWAARSSVGDREGLPTAVLTGRMGWSRVERIWLPTWARDREPVVAAVVAAAAGAPPAGQEPTRPGASGVHAHGAHLAPPVGPPAGASPPAATAAVPPALVDPASADPALVAPAGSAREPVPVRSVPTAPVATPVARPVAAPSEGPSATPSATFRPADAKARHDALLLDDDGARARARVRAEIADVVRVEGPVLADRLARVVAARFGLTRLRESRRVQLVGLVPRGLAREAANGDVVVWPDGVDPAAYDMVRAPEQGAKRDIADVPYPELRNAMVAVVRAAHGVSAADALRETARTFGVVRLGAQVRDRLEGVLAAAVREGVLAERGGRVVAV
ncbi:MULTISPECIES: DUF3320 domain-containing protein [unclassified Isoptericola]|uniref:DUF3320 domain-containing protein n=1 Tax=unclassified Isoptericola TaxID=2623355 RepID=UPI003669A4CB